MRLVHSVPPHLAVQAGTMGISRGVERRVRHGPMEHKEEVKVDTEKYLHKVPT